MENCCCCFKPNPIPEIKEPILHISYIHNSGFDNSGSLVEYHEILRTAKEILNKYEKVSGHLPR